MQGNRRPTLQRNSVGGGRDSITSIDPVQPATEGFASGRRESQDPRRASEADSRRSSEVEPRRASEMDPRGQSEVGTERVAARELYVGRNRVVTHVICPNSVLVLVQVVPPLPIQIRTRGSASGTPGPAEVEASVPMSARGMPPPSASSLPSDRRQSELRQLEGELRKYRDVLELLKDETSKARDEASVARAEHRRIQAQIDMLKVSR